MKSNFNIEIIKADLAGNAIIENLARFYVYDISRYCGILEAEFDWAFQEDGLYRCPYFSKYWSDPNCSAFMLRVNGELAGFVIVNKLGISPAIDWNLSEFFIVAKFQAKGIGRQVAVQIFDRFHGIWEVSQLPSNGPAIDFWKKVITDYTGGDYSEAKESKTAPVAHDMNVMRFKANKLEINKIG